MEFTFKKKQKITFEDKEGNYHKGVVIDTERQKGYAGSLYEAVFIKPDEPEKFDGRDTLVLPVWRVFELKD